jgi:hypothetical protein
MGAPIEEACIRGNFGGGTLLWRPLARGSETEFLAIQGPNLGVLGRVRSNSLHRPDCCVLGHVYRKPPGLSLSTHKWFTREERFCRLVEVSRRLARPFTSVTPQSGPVGPSLSKVPPDRGRLGTIP